MRNFLFVIVVFVPSFIYSQDVFPYLDNLEYLKSFQNGQSKQIDYLKPVDFSYSEKVVAYIDNKSDFFIYDGVKKEKMTGMANGYDVGIDIVAWHTGPIVSIWDDGEKQTITRFGRRYKVTDSLVVFEDLRDNVIRVYYNDSIYDLYYSIGDLRFPKHIGSNSVGFTGNGNVQYSFVAGEILEIGVINDKVKYEAGGNLVAFNDPFNQSFAVAYADEIIDVEPITVNDYKVGYDIVVYRDRNQNLKGYINKELKDLSNYSASFYEVFRDMIVWGENGFFYAYYEGKKYELANYFPSEYKIRNGIVAFRNQNGGVSVFYDEKVEIISNLRNAEFEVNGNTVRVQVNKGNYNFFKDGKIYQH
ncbi:MAG: hypothetical protein WEA99_04690 [Brumimicrobium sp.]